MVESRRHREFVRASEATVAAFMSEPLEPGGDTPIGRPIDGVSAVVLDSWLRPTPVAPWVSCT